MKRVIKMGLAGLLCAATTSLSTAKAIMIAPAPLSQRVATADCVVVGKVTGFGDKTVTANKVEYQIAIIKVESNILGAKDMKEIRVGFIPPMASAPGQPIRRRPFRGVSFTLNQEACLFLNKHPQGDFYVAPAYFSVINKGANFDKEMAEVKRCAKLLAEPKAGLEAKDKTDRILTAGMLVAQYRRYPFGGGELKTEPIDAALSKKILLTLADADWKGRPVRPVPFQMTPQSIFAQLNLTAKDGWTPPKDLKQFPEAAKTWLKDNAGKYRIQRFVHEKKEEKRDK
jgi:hypothetical protein